MSFFEAQEEHSLQGVKLLALGRLQPADTLAIVQRGIVSVGGASWSMSCCQSMRWGLCCWAGLCCDQCWQHGAPFPGQAPLHAMLLSECLPAICRQMVQWQVAW